MNDPTGHRFAGGLRLVVVVLLGAAVLLPRAAHAQTDLDPNRCTIDLPDPTTATTLGPPIPASLTTTTTKPRTTESDDGLCSGFMNQLIPGGNYGPHPEQNYDIGYDNGGNCICIARNWEGTLTDAAFGAARWFILVGLGAVNFALKFGLAKMLAPAATRMASVYQGRLIGPIGLGSFALLVCVFWGGMLAFSGRLGRGLAEVGSSLLIGAIGTTLLVNPASTLLGALDFTSGLAFEAAAMTTDTPADAPTADRVVGDSMARSIHRTMIEVPHQIVDWGRPIPPGDKCFAVYDAAVASGPWGTSSKPRVAMKKAGCAAEDKFNRDPSMDRLGAAVLVAVANFEVMALLGLVGATLIGLQLGMLGAIALAPFAWVSGALPGRGRAFFWWWVGTTAVVLTGVLAMAMLLSITLVAIASILTVTSGLPLFVQLGVPVLVVAFALRKRKRILASGHRAVSNFTARMGGGRPAQHGSWVGGGRGLVTAGAAVMVGRQVAHGVQTHKANDFARQRIATDGARVAAQAGTNDRLDELITRWGAQPEPAAPVPPPMPEPVTPTPVG